MTFGDKKQSFNNTVTKKDLNDHMISNINIFKQEVNELEET